MVPASGGAGVNEDATRGVDRSAPGHKETWRRRCGPSTRPRARPVPAHPAGRGDRQRGQRAVGRVGARRLPARDCSTPRRPCRRHGPRRPARRRRPSEHHGSTSRSRPARPRSTPTARARRTPVPAAGPGRSPTAGRASGGASGDHEPAHGDPGRARGGPRARRQPAGRGERLDVRRELLPRRVVARLARPWVAHVGQAAGGQPRPLGAAGRSGRAARRRDVPLGQGPLRRRDERPRRPARRGRRPPEQQRPAGEPVDSAAPTEHVWPRRNTQRASRPLESVAPVGRPRAPTHSRLERPRAERRPAGATPSFLPVDATSLRAPRIPTSRADTSSASTRRHMGRRRLEQRDRHGPVPLARLNRRDGGLLHMNDIDAPNPYRTRRARQQEARAAPVGRLQPRDAQAARALLDRDDRHDARVRARAQGHPVPQRPGRRRPADRRQDRRGCRSTC